MSLGRRNALLWIGLAAGLAFVAILVIALMALKGPGPADLARRLPDSVAVFAWVEQPGKLFDSAADVVPGVLANLGMDKRLAMVVQKIGFNPTTREGLEGFGLELDRPWGLAVVPSPVAEGIVVLLLPTTPGKSGPELLRKLWTSMAEESPVFAEGDASGKKVTWVRLHPEGAVKAGILSDSDYTMVLLPMRFGTVEPTLAFAELQNLANTVLERPTPRLVDSPVFGQCTEDLSGTVAGAYVNVKQLAQFAQGDQDAALAFSLMSDVQGAAGVLTSSEGSFGMHVRMAYKLAQGSLFKSRDGAAVRLVPGQPLAALHFQLNPAAVGALVERFVALDRGVLQDYAEFKSTLIRQLGIPSGTEWYGVWSGEAGVFLADYGLTEAETVRSLSAFVGVTDMPLVRSALERLSSNLSWQMAKEDNGESTAYFVQMEGVKLALVLAKGRLWFFGDETRARSLLSGEPGQVFAGGRSAEIASVMSASTSASGYADLKKPVTMAFAALGGSATGTTGTQPSAAFLPFANLFSHVEFRMTVQETLISADLSVHHSGGDPLQLLKAAVASTFSASLGTYVNRPKTTEVIDQMDKIVKGAALYVSVPRINPETGAWLPCQFPASVPMTPPIELACSPAVDRDQDGRFDENPDIWRLPTWSALQFMITGQHHCAYSFQSKGTGAEATFEVMANCDMDCDTLTSTFIRYGKAVALRPEEGASARDCTCDQTVAPYVERESE